jgi:hydroxyacyl-ACP dehydratase HTD2-like protein with hotdog domain
MKDPLSTSSTRSSCSNRFRSHYNEERPHQGIANLTPVERYLPGPAPAARLPELKRDEHKTPLYPPYSITRKVWDNGVVSYQRLAINIGRRYRGATVRLLEVGELIHLHLGEELIHVAALDRNRRYQRRGKRGGPSEACLTSHRNAVSHLTRERTVPGASRS